MITEGMSLNERQEEVREVAQRIRRVSRSAMIAGGYPRDALFGRNATDIDVWIPTSYYPDRARRLELVLELGEALGQQGFRQHGSTDITVFGELESIRRTEQLQRDMARAQELLRANNLEPDTLLNSWLVNQLVGASIAVAPSYPARIGNNSLSEVYEPYDGLFENTGGFNNLNIIFLNNRPTRLGLLQNFHINLCKCYVTDDGRAESTLVAMNDYQNQTLTINPYASGSTDVTLANSILKIRRKYPFTVNLQINNIADERWRQFYTHLFELGVLDAPRAMVQTQAEELDWHQVRFDDRADAAQGAGVVGWGQTRSVGVPPAAATGVRNAETVQPRLRTPEEVREDLRRAWITASGRVFWTDDPATNLR